MNSIGTKRVTFYLIRHIATKQIMPLARRNRGYSHWNPDSDSIITKGLFRNVPRLLESEKQAAQCIRQWFNYPNGRQTSYQTHYGEWDDIVDFKPDGRKKEDLEIVKIRMIKV